MHISTPRRLVRAGIAAPNYDGCRVQSPDASRRARLDPRQVRSFAVAGVIAVLSTFAATGSAPARPARGRLFTVAGNHGAAGRVTFGAPATSYALRWPSAILPLPGGGFLLGDFTHNRVVRVDWRGATHAFLGNGREGLSGDGGPAIQARISSALQLARRTDGGIAFIDFDTLRVVTPDGVVRKLGEVDGNAVAVAGNDENKVLRFAADGTVTTLWSAPPGSSRRPFSIAALADGTLVVSTWDPPQLATIAGDGTLTPLLSPFFSDVSLTAEPDGSVLAAAGNASPYHTGSSWVFPDPIVWRVTRDGTATAVAGMRETNQGFDGDGEDPLHVDIGPDAVSRTPDGGLLIAGYTSVRYIAPAHPALLAAAITRPTLTSPRRLRVAFALTRPARVSVAIRHQGRVVARSRDVSAPAGDGVIRLRERLAPGAYTVLLSARDPRGRVATDRQVVFVGGLLEDAQALQAANQVIADLNANIRGGGKVPQLRSCRRVTRLRVDCPEVFGGTCQAVHAVTLHRDGLPYLRPYAAGFGRHCRFHLRPHWTKPAYPARPL